MTNEARSDSSTLFARADPESILIEERFGYEQQISRNPSIGPSGSQSGSLKISVPYDGFRYFTRDAAHDVDRYLRRHGPHQGELNALVGHVAFADYQDTDLASALGLDRRLDAFPLRLPVPTSPLDVTEILAGDAHEYQAQWSYVPSRRRLDLLPIKLEVELADPDHNDLLTAAVQDYLDQDNQTKLADVAENIKRFIGFKPSIQLQIVVRLLLPGLAELPARHPVIRQLGVEMPISISLARSSLDYVNITATDVQHNPDSWHLEWCNVKMQPEPERELAKEQPRFFRSPAMNLLFKQPGELFTLPKLLVEAEVEVPGELLSGTRVRAFDALGHRHAKGRDPLTVRSVLSTRCTVVLSDAFARRMVSPYQSFHFDEIIPDPLRITDVHAALSDQRFTISGSRDIHSKGKRLLRHMLIAERADGPDTMTLLVFIEGRKHPTRRQARQPGGHQYTSKFDSGDLRMFVRGQVRRDTGNLMHEINELQLTLRERFRRLKAHR